MKKLTTRLLALSALALAGQAQAIVLFQDDFNTGPANSVLNFAGFVNWSIDNGTVDYIRSGDFGITCAGGSGGCVDLDGSTANGGRMLSTTTFNFLGGETYRLSVDISGNQRGGASDSVTFGVLGVSDATLGGLAPSEPFGTRVFTFSQAANFSGQLFLETPSNDNVGVVVDNVLFECVTCQNGGGVPEPGVLALIGAGLLGWRTRRKRG